LQKDIDVADAAYQQGVPKLEASRLSWEEVVTETCHQFEGAETDRINKLKVLKTLSAFTCFFSKPKANRTC